MSRYVQRHHGKDCLCLANGVAGLQALVVKDPVPASATYMGMWGDADWPCHVWNLDVAIWKPVGRLPHLGAQRREPLTDERLAEILRTARRVHAGPAAPYPYNPAHGMAKRIYADDAEPEPYPAPLVASTDGQQPEAKPRPVTDLAAYAEGLGWEVVAITYAQGWVPHATRGTPGANPKVSWALRMRRGDQRAVAVRMDDSWDSLWVLGADGMVKFGTLGAFQEGLR